MVEKDEAFYRALYVYAFLITISRRINETRLIALLKIRFITCVSSNHIRDSIILATSLFLFFYFFPVPYRFMCRVRFSDESSTLVPARTSAIN